MGPLIKLLYSNSVATCRYICSSRYLYSKYILLDKFQGYSSEITLLVVFRQSNPISPELVLFSDFRVLNIPRYFCFCSVQSKIVVWRDVRNSKSRNMISSGENGLSIKNTSPKWDMNSCLKEYAYSVSWPHLLQCSIETSRNLVTKSIIY